jgi:hypothetical protein
MTAQTKLLRNVSLAGASFVGIAAVLFALNPPPGVVRIVSNGFPLLLGLIGVVLAYLLFRRRMKDRTEAVIWGTMTAGLVCWTIGELIWLYFGFTGGGETPYPSTADVFWAAGYLPVAVSLGYRFALLRVTIPRPRRVLIAAIITGMVLLAVWLVVLPIATDPEAGTPAEMFFNLAYPVGDLVLLLFGLELVAAFLGGQLALSWGVIAAGILLDALSDLVFSYGIWNGLYYPAGRLNGFSAAFDILYISAYVLWNIGLFLRLRIPEPGKDVDLHAFIPEEGRDFLLLTDPQGRVVFIDPPLLPIIGLNNPSEGIGKSFGRLVGLARTYEEGAIRKAAKTGLSDDYRISLGLSKAKYLLRAVTSSDPEQFPGFEILIHPVGRQPAQTQTRNGILGHVANRARERERRRLSGEEDPLCVYVGSVIDLLFILVSRAGGAEVGAAFEAVLNARVRKENCGLRFADGRTSWSAGGEDPERFCGLMAEAADYAKLVLSPPTIRRKIEEMEKYMDPEVVMEAGENRLRMARWLEEKSG